MSYNRLTLPLFALAAAALAGCGRGSSRAADDLALDVSGWRLERAASVGGDADGRALLYSAQIVAEDPEGRFYVLNMGDRRIAVFDSAGRFLRNIGRRGHGPGEFNSPMSIAAAGDSEVYVLDAVPARLMRYRRGDGAFVGDLPLEAQSSVPMRMEVAPDGRVAVELKPMTPKTFQNTSASVVAWVDTAGRVTPIVELDSVTRLRQNTDTPGGTRSVLMDPPFAPRPVWALDGHGGVLYGHGREYAVYRRTPAGSALAFRGEGEAAAVTQVDRDGFLGTERGKALKEVEFPERKGFFSRLAVDPRGLVWVQRPGESRTESWDVRTEQGERLGTLRVPAGMRVLAVTPRSLYVLQTDELDVETLHRYRLIRGE